MKAREVRTSVTNPIRVDWLPSLKSGAIGMTFAPGKRCISTQGFLWERDLDADLAGLVERERVDVLVSLIEDDELVTYNIPNLFARAAAFRLDVHRLPVKDVDVPSDKAKVEAMLGVMRASVAAGRRVAVHCVGGLGRTGTIAGCYLVSTGVKVSDALALLRQVRGPRCPETDAQRSYVSSWRAAERHRS